jgi:hypothetical protein
MSTMGLTRAAAPSMSLNSVGGPPALKKKNKGGYHEYVDDVQVIIGGHVDDVVNGAAGANVDGCHICLIGAAAQTDPEWHDQFSQAVGVNGAARVRNACLMLGVPMQLLTTEQVKSGKLGIVGTCTSQKHSRRATTRTRARTGPHFPWTEFMQTVKDGEDMPLSDVDEKWIFEAIIEVVRKEGISKNAQTAAVQATKAARKLGA